MKKSKPQENPERTCNCRIKSECPINGKCLTKCLIYQATVKTLDDGKEETYVGLTENTFKTRYTGHKASFRNESKKHETTLSQYIWTLKNSNTQYDVNWKIIAKCKPYSPSDKTCSLCTKEKYFIICKPEIATLNTRNELASECKHKKKHLLCNH